MERLPLKHGLMDLVCAQKLDFCKVSGFRLDEFLNVIVYAARCTCHVSLDAFPSLHVCMLASYYSMLLVTHNSGSTLRSPYKLVHMFTASLSSAARLAIQASMNCPYCSR
ncbi:hypothetical protein KCU95_g23, partial [Aureobasidium melanogenum]